jgi:ADP-ribose pyrophosphatase YjhB (NUDIX family)
MASFSLWHINVICKTVDYERRFRERLRERESMMKTRTAGGVVVNPEGQILVVNQRGDSWSLPKGHIDAGEDALEAAMREIYEESGVRELELVRELGSYHRYKISEDGGDDFRELKRITMFLFRTPQMELRPIDPANPEARWVEREKVSELLTHWKDKEWFAGLEL